MDMDETIVYSHLEFDELFTWMNEHPFVYLHLEGQYMGRDETMRIIMEHKKYVCKVAQIITNTHIIKDKWREELQQEHSLIVSILDEMYEYLIRRIYEQERGV